MGLVLGQLEKQIIMILGRDRADLVRLTNSLYDSLTF